ncbi:hypothetical protein BpHYR1_020571 [Brachionus plicatilis]|uniref:Uncharacterized protein n=1 Tax=Brachionus plicatilis TaxID=10195 RepID=A0A3M7QIG6_BRAPC|nr:hypothetical protein BpHYR1_020571 [Brachionus plicatilis]
MQACRSENASLIESIDREGIMGTSDSSMRQKLDENSESNEIIQNRKSYEFKAPLIADEDLDQIVSPDKNSRFNHNSDGQRVKFYSDKNPDYEQLEPLIKNSDQSSRFKIAQVKDIKNLLDTCDDKAQFLIDDQGVLIRKSPSYLSETNRLKKNSAEVNEDSKPINFKYNKDAKSLECETLPKFQLILAVTEIHRNKGALALFAEFLGTYILVLFVIGFGLPISDPNVTPPEINGCLGSGLISKFKFSIVFL